CARYSGTGTDWYFDIW
nr:immunoglobulin heavy chain junction region [Macaca mulatta]MOX93665.1 immunoglobulin heavy chain junction region [Macaca mulatta]MOX95434.1 immunoglobulin heavy chain junction region [Macaca mulatta]MOX95870.1 immunoglobulin heavy chain junction region [Macaca mulatta]MOX96292.1 immunoglobulin heavy chain junction region [Macaca mulatta]